MRAKSLLGCAIGAVILAVAGAVALHRMTGPFHYSADDVQGTVIDGLTGAPVAGALVIGQWRLETIGDPRGLFHAAEAITGSDGRYRLRGFASKPRPFLEWFETDDPKITIYKPGYRPEVLTNRDACGIGNDYARASKRISYWNGKSISLYERLSLGEVADVAKRLEDTLLWDGWSFPLAHTYLAADATPIPLDADPRLRDTDPTNDPPRELAMRFAPFTSPPIHGVVIDGDGARVPGAVVAAVWRLVDTHTGAWSGVFAVRETTSDPQGRFVIPGWSARFVPAEATIDGRSPEMWVIKRGFVVAYFDNMGAQEGVLSFGSAEWRALPPKIVQSSEAGSRWDGQALRIRRARSGAELVRSLNAANPRGPGPAPPPFRRYFEEWRQSAALLPARDRPAVPF